MLKKSIKYNWLSTYKIILLLNVYLIISTLIGIITLKMGVWNSKSDGITSLGAGLFIIYIISITFVSMIATIYLSVRYYRNMYTDEGYLIHTLPISKHTLLISQTIVGTIHLLITTVIMLVCIFGLIYFLVTCLDPQTQSDLQINYEPGIWEELRNAFSDSPVLKVFFIILYFVSSCMEGILLPYCAISLGQLFVRHKIIGSIICYIGLYTILQILTSVITLPFMGLSLFGNVSFTQLIDCGVIIETIFAIMCCIVFYGITYYLCNKKLNLD